MYHQAIGGGIAGRDELVTDVRIEESVGRPAVLGHGQNLNGQVGDVLREGRQRRQRSLALGRVHQDEAVNQVVPAPTNPKRKRKRISNS